MMIGSWLAGQGNWLARDVTVLATEGEARSQGPEQCWGSRTGVVGLEAVGLETVGLGAVLLQGQPGIIQQSHSVEARYANSVMLDSAVSSSAMCYIVALGLCCAVMCIVQ